MAVAELTEEQLARVRAAVLALPPLTDEQVDAVCEIIVKARLRWHREDAQSSPVEGTQHRGNEAAPGSCSSRGLLQ